MGCALVPALLGILAVVEADHVPREKPDAVRRDPVPLGSIMPPILSGVHAAAAVVPHAYTRQHAGGGEVIRNNGGSAN